MTNCLKWHLLLCKQRHILDTAEGFRHVVTSGTTHGTYGITKITIIFKKVFYYYYFFLEKEKENNSKRSFKLRMPDVDKDCDVGKDMEIIFEPPNSSGKRCTVRSAGREETKQEMPSFCFNYCWINVELESDSKQ